MEDKHWSGTPKKYAFTPDEWGEKAEVWHKKLKNWVENQWVTKFKICGSNQYVPSEMFTAIYLSHGFKIIRIV